MNQPKVTLAIDLDRVVRMGDRLDTDEDFAFVTGNGPITRPPITVYVVQGDKVHALTFNERVTAVIVSARERWPTPTEKVPPPTPEES